MVMRWLNIAFLLFMIPVCSALTEVEISLNRNDIATEDFIITIDSEKAYDQFEFQAARPISVIYDGTYRISDSGIIFDKEIVPGENTLEFSLIYDGLVESKGSLHIFRTSIVADDAIVLRLNLPEKNTISDAPGAIPAPSKISTDGKKISLEWEFQDDATVAVFYESEKDYTFWIIAAAVLMIAASSVIFYKLSNKKVLDILTRDEQDVLELVRKGILKQSEVAEKLGFSKSKMSKVIRKLEEKNLIKKEPYFKTNVLKLK
jgi:uncharacterized membrane protein